MFTRKRMMVSGGVLAVLGMAAMAAVTVWWNVFRSDAPAEVSLTQAVAATNATTTVAAAVTNAEGRAASLARTWTLADEGESFVGYRVREELTTIGAFTAVGRTKNLIATLTFDGSAITDVRVEADLSGLQSDNSLRDGALRRQALETNQYPTATFVLTQPIALTGVPAAGEPVTATAAGELTLHEVTRPVSIPIEGQLVNGLVVVVGSTDIRFADYGIATPSAPVVASVEDHGALELQLVFERAAAQS